MPRIKVLPILALATLSATAVLAQNSVTQGNSNYTTQSQGAAPIERGANTNNYPPNNFPVNRRADQFPVITSSRPAQGVTVRVDQHSSVQTVSADPNRVELRVVRGRANVGVHDPAHDALVLVDLPGGQTQLLKNGLYTFNAGTNTVSVLRGEASAFPGQDTKAIKVKEDHQLTFSGDNVRSVDVGPFEARADLLPGAYADARPRYGDGFYGDGYYGDPYYAYGYPGFYDYGYGYPYGFGFGYYGGFGYGGGFRGGGFHGGGGGFHGGGGHGGGGGHR